ncbi:orotate phosphoribosyltransferase [Streptacidiphilus sp. PB12-B1b]|uniref:orotate phosphoribosyltransferase n=1 Tax=Streptacidiphilus sp. PB12-B1b TaxID=2705012 RepID=UPI0015FC94F9|nr:phosphoribosyltransferase family protein [Streptacidiphilus sp. PB12-B1b]QMU74594.1 orotate phosphoribosyltransferase [Streptacidiphilus sp. PB12-B1b]
MTTSSAPAGLAARLAETACVTAPFKLATGSQLDSYFDEYRLASDPALLRDTATAMAALVPDSAEVLAGVELGGVPLVVALSAATGLPAVFLRRQPKRYGSRRQIEGATVDGRRAVLVDDVVRSGGQLLTMARTLRMVGAPVTDALCVLERPLGGRMMLADHRVTLHALLTEADLPAPRAGECT